MSGDRRKRRFRDDFINQILINLVHYQKSVVPAYPGCNCAEFALWNDCAARVVRRGDKHATGFQSPVPLYVVERQLIVLPGARGGGNRYSVKQPDEMAITWIARIRNQDFVSDINQRSEREQQRTGCAGSNDDALPGYSDAKLLLIEP